MQPTVILLALAVVVRASPIGKVMVVLGDSFSDTGNLHNAVQQARLSLLLNHALRRSEIDADLPPQLPNTVLPSPIYWKGRASGAPGIWVDHLSHKLGVSPSVFAFAAAPACPRPGYPRGVLYHLPDLWVQYELYHEKFATDKQYRQALRHYGHFVLLWTGHHDVLEMMAHGGLITRPLRDQHAQIRAVVGCIQKTLQALLAGGEPGIVVATLLPLEHTPFAQIMGNMVPGFTSTLTFAISQLNSQIRSMVASMAKMHPQTRLVLWDVARYVVPIIEGWKEHGFATAQSCYSYSVTTSLLAGAEPIQSCDDPDSHLWHDDLHPSSKVHAMLAAQLAALLRQKGITKGWAAREEAEAHRQSWAAHILTNARTKVWGAA